MPLLPTTHADGQAAVAADINAIAGAANAVTPTFAGATVVGGAGGSVLRTHAGFLDPAPTVARLLPPVATSIAGLTYTAGTSGAASTITGSTLVPMTDARFAYFGCPTGFGGTETTTYWAPENVYAWDGSATVYAPGDWAVEFAHYGQAFELLFKGVGALGYYRVQAYGLGYDALDGRVDAGATGATFLMKYDFGSVDFRTIRVSMAAYTHFGGVRIGPTDSLWPTQLPRGPKVAVLGDSFVTGSNATTGYRGFAHGLGKLLGWRNVRAAGGGGTGYLNPGTGKVKYRDRVTKDIVNWAPDIVLVQGSINDSSFGSQPATDLAAEAPLLFNAIKTGLPNAKLIVLLVFPMTGSVSAAHTANRDAVKTAALAVPADLVVDPIAGTWITGTGHAGALTGSGNADVFTSSDATHPGPAGHDYVAQQVASAIAAALPF